MTISSASEPETKIKGIIDHLVRTVSAAARPSDPGRSKSEMIRFCAAQFERRTKSSRVCTEVISRNDASRLMVTHFPTKRIGPSLSTTWVDCRFSFGTAAATAPAGVASAAVLLASTEGRIHRWPDPEC
jgi:hypothetical protein